MNNILTICPGTAKLSKYSNTSFNACRLGRKIEIFWLIKNCTMLINLRICVVFDTERKGIRNIRAVQKLQSLLFQCLYALIKKNHFGKCPGVYVCECETTTVSVTLLFGKFPVCVFVCVKLTQNWHSFCYMVC